LDLIPRPDLAVSDLLKERLIVRSDFDRTRFSATHGPSSLLKEDLTSSIAAALEFRALLMAGDTRSSESCWVHRIIAVDRSVASQRDSMSALTLLGVNAMPFSHFVAKLVIGGGPRPSEVFRRLIKRSLNDPKHIAWFKGILGDDQFERAGNSICILLWMPGDG